MALLPRGLSGRLTACLSGRRGLSLLHADLGDSARWRRCRPRAPTPEPGRTPSRGQRMPLGWVVAPRVRACAGRTQDPGGIHHRRSGPGHLDLVIRMIEVCNTSPISSLIQIGYLTLLEKLFTELWIPPEGVTELRGRHRTRRCRRVPRRMNGAVQPSTRTGVEDTCRG